MYFKTMTTGGAIGVKLHPHTTRLNEANKAPHCRTTGAEDGFRMAIPHGCDRRSARLPQRK